MGAGLRPAASPGSLDHKGATTSMVLGIISMVSLVLASFCCITLPVSLRAVRVGHRRQGPREIDAAPGAYGNRGSAQAGMVMGIVMHPARARSLIVGVRRAGRLCSASRDPSLV